MARGEPTKTIGNARAAGETRFTVHCGRIECGHRAELAFESACRMKQYSFTFPGCSISFARNAEAGT
jgi:hypothetical protein